MDSKLTIFSALTIFLFAATFGGAFFTQATAGGVALLSSLGAQVGVSVGVEPTEWSQVAQEVEEKQKELEARELAIVEKEQELALDGALSSRYLEYYITAMAFILLLLVLLNFYLDYRRGRPVQQA